MGSDFSAIREERTGWKQERAMGQHRSKSIVQEKSFRFAVDIVAYARRHQNDRINLVLTSRALDNESQPSDFQGGRDPRCHKKWLQAVQKVRSARTQQAKRRSVLSAVRRASERRENVAGGLFQQPARQLHRSGTSIGAHVEEALGGQSRKDFIAKLAIAAKEARETGYWLRLIRETQPHNIQGLTCLLTECDALKAMLNSIILTTRNTLTTQYSELRSPNSEHRTQHSEPPPT